MSLFSGEPSAVTIVASHDLEVMKISASVVNRMIDRQPSFAREIGQRWEAEEHRPPIPPILDQRRSQSSQEPLPCPGQ